MMNQLEKQKFLEMDLAQRMMRVEQNLASAFDNKKLKPEETEYYKKMSAEKKMEYCQFAKTKKKRNSFFAGLAVLPLLAFGFSGSGLTGNVIAEGGSGFSWPDPLLMLLFGLLILFFVILFIDKKLIDHRLNKHIKVIEHVLARGYNRYKLNQVVLDYRDKINKT